MRILLIGSGGREHALAWKIIKSKNLNQLFIAPGNAGTAQIAINIELTPFNFESIAKFVLTNKIDMVVVGPEDPLVNGIHDFFHTNERLRHVPVIGPEKAGAMLEGSKDFAKEFMFRHNIPTARYLSVTNDKLNEGKAFLKTLKPPYVLKADGLAAGKGVLILDSLAEAEKELEAMLQGKFGKASSTVVIEEYLKGIEMSAFAVTDGESYLVLPEAKDYKRIGEGDTGPNTGGMGAVSPVPFADKKFLDKVEKRIIKPTIDGLKKDKIPYKGFLFFGLMNVSGDPFIIEYNVRLGDPESEVIIPRIKTDIIEIFEAIANQTLKNKTIEFDDRIATTVMLVSGGYPDAYAKGYEINHLEKVSGSVVFHAGTTMNNGKIVTNGGRVLALTSMGNSIKDALKNSFANAEVIEFTDKYYRKDIGFDLQ
jgi:phosphoribosylamine---glycine ligase